MKTKRKQEERWLTEEWRKGETKEKQEGKGKHLKKSSYRTDLKE